MNSNVNQILAEVHKVIVGKDDVMEKILMEVGLPMFQSDDSLCNSIIAACTT